MIIADDLFVGLQHGTDVAAEMALYEKRSQGCFTDERYANLGGVGIFWIENDGQRICYEMRLFLNPHALPSTLLPDDMRLGFRGHEGAKPDDGSTAAGFPPETPFQRWLRDDA
ncbi:MAG TPA: hypothetical protein VKU44_02090 [Terriglobia bacterium]|nr:hypothetical protein [Terriglobia bacterium]